VGKEVVARLIHGRSRRAHAPLIALNCAGVPDTLLASELFGHVRGSFTDAYTDKPGWLERADGGTLFLDEVGEMSLQMQALLLRFLESGEIQRIGSERARMAVNVRVIAATNRRLIDRVATKEFRDDLYYRLNVLHIDIPPLRNRIEDLPALAEFFIQQHAQHYDLPAIRIEEDAYRCLMDYPWPGNVRELRNVLERIVVRGRGETVTRAALPREILAGAAVADTGRANGSTSRDRADLLFEKLVVHRQNFWEVVGEPFLARDLTRDDVRTIVQRGLELSNGSYKALVPEFNMPRSDYKKFVAFLRKYQVHLPVPELRPARVMTPDRPPRERVAGE
jgi:transcriptional regulator with PAS, ATPase and Fis domain